MGFGEVIGNQSVHWTIVHEEHGSPAADRTRLKGTAPTQGLENLVVGDFDAKGSDKVPFGLIGRGPGDKKHPGKFRVELRFESEGAAKAALGQAVTIGATQKGGAWVLELDVPAVNRQAGQVNPANPPAEVRIDW